MKLLRAIPAFALLVLAGIWFSGCSTTYQKAGVNVVLSAATVNADNTVTLALQLQNENLMGVAISRTEFKVNFDGVNYGTALGTKPVALAALGTSQHEAVLRLSDAAAAARLRSALGTRPVAYVFDCRLRCDVGEEELILTATARGQVGGQ